MSFCRAAAFLTLFLSRSLFSDTQKPAVAGKDSKPAAVEKIECTKTPPPDSKLLRSEVYKTSPFKAGEIASYDVNYGGLAAGTGVLEVRPPVKHNGAWHRVFHAEAKTGEWFEKVYVAHDVVESFSQPSTFAVSKFYLEQNEGKLFSKPLNVKKWLDFSHHESCKVKEKIQKLGKEEEFEEHDLQPGAIDALGAVFFLRTLSFKLEKKERALIYTSEKNWWLEVTPLLFEPVTTKAGTFDAVKVQLVTYLGKELQQKGKVFAWFSRKDPFPMVKLEAEIKIGSVQMMLAKLVPGQ